MKMCDVFVHQGYFRNDQVDADVVQSISICRLLVHVHGDGAALLFQRDSQLERQAGRRDAVAQRVKAVSCKLSWHHHHVGGGTSQALLWTSGD